MHRLLSTALIVAAVCFATACSPGCPTAHIVDQTANLLGATENCGSSNVAPEIAATVSGTIVSLTYKTEEMVCGGEFVVDINKQDVIDRSVNKLVLTHHVEGSQSDCGCYNVFEVHVEVEVCAPGAYVFVVGDEEYQVEV